MDPRRRVDACECNFENCKCAVHSMLADVGPCVESMWEPARRDSGPEDDAPVDESDEERVRRNSGMEKGV